MKKRMPLENTREPKPKGHSFAKRAFKGVIKFNLGVSERMYYIFAMALLPKHVREIVKSIRRNAKEEDVEGVKANISMLLSYYRDVAMALTDFRRLYASTISPEFEKRLGWISTTFGAVVYRVVLANSVRIKRKMSAGVQLSAIRNWMDVLGAQFPKADPLREVIKQTMRDLLRYENTFAFGDNEKLMKLAQGHV